MWTAWSSICGGCVAPTHRSTLSRRIPLYDRNEGIKDSGRRRNRWSGESAALCMSCLYERLVRLPLGDPAWDLLLRKSPPRLRCRAHEAWTCVKTAVMEASSAPPPPMNEEAVLLHKPCFLRIGNRARRGSGLDGLLEEPLPLFQGASVYRLANRAASRHMHSENHAYGPAERCGRASISHRAVVGADGEEKGGPSPSPAAHTRTWLARLLRKAQCPQLRTGRCVVVRATLHRSGLAANALCIEC